MNVFATDKCPIKSAKFLDDARVNKMVLETAQILSTVVRGLGINDSRLYKSTHSHHPVVKWTGSTLGNFKWLIEHFRALSEEKIARTGKEHSTAIRFQYGEVFTQLVQDSTLSGNLEGFVNCAANNIVGVSYKHLENTTLAYKLYLKDRWKTDKREPKWSIK